MVKSLTGSFARIKEACCLNINAAVNRIMENYGNIAGITRLELEEVMDSGLTMGFSIRQVYNAVRLVLGIQHRQQEIFSANEAAEIMRLSESTLFSKIQELGTATEHTSSKTFYFPDLT